MRYSIVMLIIFIFAGCGGSDSSSSVQSQSNDDTILQRVVLNDTQSITCSNETDFEVVPYGTVSIEATYDESNNWTYLIASSNSVGYIEVIDCQIIE